MDEGPNWVEYNHCGPTVCSSHLGGALGHIYIFGMLEIVWKQRLDIQHAGPNKDLWHTCSLVLVTGRGD